MSDQSGPQEELPEDDGVLEPSDSLEDDDLSDDPLDAGIEPPDHWSAAEGFGSTLEEARRGESLDQLLAEEEPDQNVDDEGEYEGEDEYGEEDEYSGYQVGERSAEQAAVHVIEEEEEEEEDL